MSTETLFHPSTRRCRVLLQSIPVAVAAVTWLATARCTLAAPPANSTGGGTEAATSAAGATRGAELYAHHCAACHGEGGDGKGLAAAYLFPKPRDLRAGRFRLVSTANNVPTRDDLHSVLVRGMPGSSMPSWQHLPPQDRQALVDEIMNIRRQGAREFYIRTLKEEDELSDQDLAAEDVQQEIKEYVDQFTIPGETTTVPEIGGPTDEAIAQGKQVYGKFGCLQCHGESGKGDGVQKMVDEETYPTAPRDFTAGIFKGGHDPASLYRRIAYGMPGTPMPSSSQMTAEQMVNLVHYIRSLSTEQQREAAVLNRTTIVARRLATVPLKPDASAWRELPTASVRMTPLWWRDSADPGLQVQAAYDGATIALRLSWRDDSADWHATRSEAFEDAIAVEIYRGEAEPFVGMGDPRVPVDVWFWDADRQTARDLEDQYPRVVADIYPFSESLVETAEYGRNTTRRDQQPAVSVPAVAAGNPIAAAHPASGATSLTAGGPGSVTFRIPRSQHVTARAAWSDGQWSLVMARPLQLPAAESGVSLAAGDKVSAAFAVWNGSAQDRDGIKLITIWQDLELAK